MNKNKHLSYIIVTLLAVLLTCGTVFSCLDNIVIYGVAEDGTVSSQDDSNKENGTETNPENTGNSGQSPVVTEQEDVSATNDSVTNNPADTDNKNQENNRASQPSGEAGNSDNNKAEIKANGNVCKIVRTNVEYSSINNALSAASDGDTIMLIDSYELDETITLNRNIEVTITSEKPDEYKIYKKYNYSGTIYDYRLFRINTGTLNLTNITIDGRGYKYDDFGTGTSGALALVRGGVLNIGEGACLQNGSCVDNGGAINVESGTCNMTGGEIKNCSADDNGGAVSVYAQVVSLYTEAAFNMTGGTISECTAGGKGGGVFVFNRFENGYSSFIMDAGTTQTGETTTGTITNCTANGSSNYSGGAVCVEGANSTFEMKAGIISSCHAANSSGGGIAVGYWSGLAAHAGQATISGGMITSCDAKNSGDAVYLSGIMNMSGGAITANDGENCSGNGAVAFYSSGSSDYEGRLNLSGSPMIFNNKQNGQKNVNIDKGNTTTNNNMVNNKIKVSGTLNPDALVYIYEGDYRLSGKTYKGNAVDSKFALRTGGDIKNYDIFRNDRLSDNGKELVGYHQGSNKIVWREADWICKITDAEGHLLYKSDITGEPAIYQLLGNTSNTEGAFNTVVYYKLYKKDPDTNQYIIYSAPDYADVATNPPTITPVCVKMLKDYTLPGKAGINLRHSTAAYNYWDVTLTTAETNETVDGDDDPYVYIGQDLNTPAIISATAATDRESMFTTRGDLTLKYITLDGRSNAGYSSKDSGSLLNVKDKGKIIVDDNTTLRNGRSNDTGSNGDSGGGAICCNNYVEFKGNNILIDNCSAANRAGAVYVSKGDCYLHSDSITISNCSATVGAGIYVKAKETNRSNQGYLHISGNPTFINNTTNGNEQDIYLPATASPLPRLKVDGALTCGKGKIFVWAEHENHYKVGNQFAVIENLTVKNSLVSGGNLVSTLRAFKNARPGSETGDTDEVGLFGAIKNSDANQLQVIWELGTNGKRKVILRKIQKSGAQYVPKTGVTFTLYSYDGTTETKVWEGKGPSANGVFYIGELSYGDYLIKESTGEWYYLIVHEKGVFADFGGNTNVSIEGSTEAAAKGNLSAAKSSLGLN